LASREDRQKVNRTIGIEHSYKAIAQRLTAVKELTRSATGIGRTSGYDKIIDQFLSDEKLS